MLVEDVCKIEKEYYSDRLERVVPDLMCVYFEQKEYELTYYFAYNYLNMFVQSEFYLMMSLMELGYTESANRIYKRNKEEWFNLCKQGTIYWKHVALFALLFMEYNLSDYYENLFDSYYDDIYVQLIELIKNENIDEVTNTECFKKVIKLQPLIEKINALKKTDVPKVITFENIEWNIWKKYNSEIGNGQKFFMEKVYEQEGLYIYSYKPKEVAASMHIISDGKTSIVLDCGCEFSDTESIRIPVKEIFDYYGIGKIDAIFISHAHMDHYGSLNELRNENIYMTSITKQLIRLSSPEIILSSVNVLDGYSSADINGVRVTFIPNGHIRGSVAMDIDWKGMKRIVYTGDFSIDNQATVEGWNIDDILLQNNKKIDILITETTYGMRKDMLSLKHYETMFVKLCQKQIENDNKVIIPCFAIGRVQEVAMLLAPMVRKLGKKILIEGLAARITEFYQLNMAADILNKNISVCNNDFDYSEKIFNNDIILASSGMIKPGSTSAHYVEKMMEKENVCLMKVGFIHQEEHMLVSIVNRKSNNINYVDIPLSAHVSYRRLVETLEKLSPDYAIYVHGAGIER